jgi:DNA-binding transcriptional LysR family regulator
MDRLQAMQTFVRVVESGSFSAVARELRSTQSAVSKQVAALERMLGARLLNRTTRSLALTEEGERYFEQARRLVAEIADAEGAVRSGAQELGGSLRLAAAVGFGRLKLLPLVDSFLQQHPKLNIDLRLNDGYIDLVEQGIDLAVRVGHQPDSSLVARRIGWSQRRLIAHRDLVRRWQRKGPKAPRQPDDLHQHNCIVYTELRSVNAWTFVAGPGANEPVGTERVVRVQGSLQTNSSEVVRAAVLAGMGIGYSPEWLFEPELARGELVTLMPGWETPALPLQLVSPAQRMNVAKVKALAAHLVSGLSPAPAHERQPNEHDGERR